MGQVLTHQTANQPTQELDFSCCRVVLQQVLLQKQQKNRRYSLRAFARDLKISPSFLSEVLNGKYGISKQLAEQISERLSFSKESTETFCLLAHQETSNGRARKRDQKSTDSRALDFDMEAGEDEFELRFADLRDTIHRLMQSSGNNTFMLRVRC